LPGAFRAQLLTLRRSQRDQYLVLALDKSANDLAAKLNNSRTLDELTRTPLILAEVTELFRRGSPIPTTKTGILAAVMRMVEESEQHHAFLQQAPLSGHAGEYLCALSMAMTEGGAVEISEADGCAVVRGIACEHASAPGNAARECRGTRRPRRYSALDRSRLDSI